MGIMGLPDADRRAFYACAIGAAALLVVVPRPAQGRVMFAVAAAAAIAYVYTSSASAAAEAASPSQTPSVDDHERRRRKGSFARIDPVLFTLRYPEIDEARSRWINGDASAARGDLKNLAFRCGGDLLELVRRAARLGSRNGNAASGARAMASLEDFFSRYHRAMLSADAGLAARTLDVLRDTRVTALNALQDVLLTVPPDLGTRVLRATDAVRTETLRCMTTLSTKHAGSPEVAVARARWASPAPHDPGGVVGRADSLY